MKIERRVDTVIVEMDISTAQKLLALVVKSYDNTINPGDLTEFAIKMQPHLLPKRIETPIFVAGTNPSGYFEINENPELYGD